MAQIKMGFLVFLPSTFVALSVVSQNLHDLRHARRSHRVMQLGHEASCGDSSQAKTFLLITSPNKNKFQARCTLCHGGRQLVQFW